MGWKSNQADTRTVSEKNVAYVAQAIDDAVRNSS